jgi:hypothetical protein
VSWVGLEPSDFIFQMSCSKLPSALPRVLEKAMYLPLGEKAG